MNLDHNAYLFGLRHTILCYAFVCQIDVKVTYLYPSSFIFEHKEIKKLLQLPEILGLLKGTKIDGKLIVVIFLFPCCI